MNALATSSVVHCKQDAQGGILFRNHFELLKRVGTIPGEIPESTRVSEIKEMLCISNTCGAAMRSLICFARRGAQTKTGWQESERRIPFALCRGVACVPLELAQASGTMWSWQRRAARSRSGSSAFARFCRTAAASSTLSRRMASH